MWSGLYRAIAEIGALVPVDDAPSLAEAIIDEIEQETKKSKGVYANRYAYENYTWTRQVARMVELYEGAIAQRGEKT